MQYPLTMQLRKFMDLHRKNEYAIKPYLILDGNVHKVAIICPGGGYRKVSGFVEGYPYAKALNRLGYHAFVVYYRVREHAAFPNPQEDLARAVREIHSRAQKWKLDMEGYSLWGSSAGGHLAAGFGTETIGYPRYGLPRPGALILAYPVITMGQGTHVGSCHHLLGEQPDPMQRELTSIEKQVGDSFPPTFLWWGDQDTSVDPVNSRLLHSALTAHNIPCQCREYPGVGHGVGLGKGLSCEGWLEEAVRFWENCL